MRGMPAQTRKKRQASSAALSHAPSAALSQSPSGRPVAAVFPEALREQRRSDVADNEDVGFLGSTAFNAVFTENQQHIPSDDTAEVANSNTQLHEEITASRKPYYRWGTVEALFVLEVLKDLPYLEKIVDRWPKFEASWCMLGPWLQDCQKSIRQDLFEKYDLTSSDVCTQVTELLHANTMVPLRLAKNVRFRDFTSYYTGTKLRWEAIGVFLTICGYSLMFLPCEDKELDFVGHSEQDKQRLLIRLLEAGDACVAFCNETVHDTDLSFWLMIENCTFASQVLGDAHYSVWRRLGDLSTAIFARGLHAIGEGSGLPLWLTELRRKGLSIAYVLDKTLSSFVGRPPRISKRYCHIEAPLDLEFDELALEGDELAEVVSKLDVNGWKTRTEPERDRFSGCLRLWVKEGRIREEALELCLGPPQEGLREKAQSILDRCKGFYDSTPHMLQPSPEMWAPHSVSRTSYPVMRQYLEHTYDEFMIRRMLVRRFQEDPTELVQLAHKILIVVIEMRNMRGVLSTSACLSWMIVLNGLPAAAVLALELLQLNVNAISHARVKQDLCVFISYLKWVHIPGEGNFSLADRGRKTLQHIMDKVLATEAPRLEQQEQRRAEGVTGGVDSTALVDDLGVYDFSWLDAGHFDQDFWDNLNSIESATVPETSVICRGP